MHPVTKKEKKVRGGKKSFFKINATSKGCWKEVGND